MKSIKSMRNGHTYISRVHRETIVKPSLFICRYNSFALIIPPSARVCCAFFLYKQFQTILFVIILDYNYDNKSDN